MVRRKEMVASETKPAPFNGVGEITAEMYEKGRVFAHTTVDPGSKIGVHQHKGDAETYYIMSGSGKYYDNGTVVDVHPGDVFFCADGESHSIEAIGEPIEMIALILYH